MTKYAEFPPYARILEATGLRTQQELAEALGVRPPSITFALRRQNIPTGWLVTLVENYGLNPAWIKTGTGAQRLVPEEGK